MRHFFRVEKIEWCGSNWPLGTKVIFFCFGIAIFVNTAYHQYTPVQLSHSVSEQCIIFQGSPRFLAVSGHTHFAIISTLNFGLLSTKLGGNVRAIKKWPRMTTDLVRAGVTKKRLILRSNEMWFFGRKCVFPPKNTQNLSDIYFGKGYFFPSTTLPGHG